MPVPFDELMYVKCAYCGAWLDVKPGHMTDVSHGMCPDCLAKELEKLRANPPLTPPNNHPIKRLPPSVTPRIGQK